MKQYSHSPTLAECKIQASILLKSLRSNQADEALRALKRLQRLPQFVAIEVDEIKRKHVLAVIAFEKHFDSWSSLKNQIGFIIGGFLNHWFPNYQDAKKYQTLHGGYLFPYKKQFFICDESYIIALGFDPQDEDWVKIDKDWAKPTDSVAFQRLYQQWLKIQGEKNAK